jgi:hypothetical protein
MIQFTFVILWFFVLKQPLVFGGSTGIIYGQNHAYALTAPEGWVLDNSSGVSEGLHAVFYPAASSWAGAATVMYTNVALCDLSKKEKIEDIMKYDIEKFRQDSPNLRVEKKEGIGVCNGRRKARVVYFSCDRYGHHEAVAYIPENKVVVMIVMRSRNKKEFDSSLKAFEELVKSYNFITDKVIRNKSTNLKTK